MRISILSFAALTMICISTTFGQPTPTAGPYKVLNKYPVGGAGGMDYVTAVTENRQLLIPRSSRVDIFDLDTLKPVASISPAAGVHGAIVDPVSGHGFCSSKPVVMWDSKTNQIIKTIDVQGNPDGILFDPFTQHVHILSHSAPNVTVIDTKDGTVLGTIDLGGSAAPVEQGQSDGNGKLYISVEVNPGKVEVIDAKTMKRITTYSCGDKAGTLAGLAYDAKNKLIFACGRNPANCVVMNADDGSIIATLPIGAGVDSAAFNPATNEVFVSTGTDGQLTIIKEVDPKTFVVEQTVATLRGGKTCTIDTKSGNVYVIANDPSVPVAGAPAPVAAPPATTPAAGRAGRGGRGGPAGTFSIVVIGK